MKKFLYIALAAAAITSCSQDETLELNQEAISFGEAIVNNATRAAAKDNTYGSDKLIESFKVWGTVTGSGNNNGNTVQVFNGANVTDEGENNTTIAYGKAWKCDVTQYWIYGATYNFAAVVDAEANDVTLTNSLPSSIAYTASTQKDILYAEAKGISHDADDTAEDKLVKFDFSHLLSKVKFAAKNTTTDTQYTYNIKNLTITNSVESGSVAVPAKTWTPNTNSSTYEGTDFGGIDGVTYKTDNTVYECATEMLLIPANFETTKLNISFDLEWCYKGSVITSTPKTLKASINLVSGNAYKFTISTGLNAPIEFTVNTLTDWVDANPQPDDLEF